jgi:hypothetical protein
MKGDCFIIIFLLLLSINFVFAGYTGKVMVGQMGAVVDPGIIVNDSDFINGGDSTLFLYMSDVELQNITSMTLHIPSEVKVVFLQNINLTIDSVNNYVPLSENVIMYYKYVFINSSVLTSLNERALIYFYNLDFIQPKVLRNGVDCGTFCTTISYTDGNLIVEVDSFSEYSVVEGYVSDGESDGGSSGGGGGGGGGGGSLGDYLIDDDFEVLSDDLDKDDGFYVDFNVSDYFVNVNLYPGETFVKEIIVENNGTENLSVAVDFEDVGAFVTLDDMLFNLSVGEKKSLFVHFYFPLGKDYNIYFGKINFNSKRVKKSSNLVLNLNPNSSFEVAVALLRNQITVYDNPTAIILLRSFEERNVYVNMTYAILDKHGNIIDEKNVKVFVDDSLKVKKSFDFPNDLKGGDYLFYAGVNYGDEYAFGSDSFFVYGKSFASFLRYLGENGLIILVLVLMLFFILIIKRYKENIFKYD